MAGVRAYYALLVAENRGPDAVDLPPFDELSQEAVIAWMLACAAALQVTAHTAEALHLTLEDS